MKLKSIIRFYLYKQEMIGKLLQCRILIKLKEIESVDYLQSQSKCSENIAMCLKIILFLFKLKLYTLDKP